MKRKSRRGAAAVEMAILAPFLIFIVVVGVDWSRIFYMSVTLTNCARNGALNASDPYSLIQPAYDNVTAAALADAPNLSPQPQVMTATGSDSSGTYLDCTVTSTFKTLTNLPGVPSNTIIKRTVRVYQSPRLPT